MTTELCLSIPQHSSLKYINCSLCGHLVEKKGSLILPYTSEVLFFSTERVCLPHRWPRFKERCTFGMIITSQQIFVTPCSLAGGWAIGSERWQMFSELTYSPPKSPAVSKSSRQVWFVVKGGSRSDFFNSRVFLINWHKGNPAVSWQEGVEAEVSDLNPSLTLI